MTNRDMTSENKNQGPATVLLDHQSAKTRKYHEYKLAAERRRHATAAV